MQLRNSKIVNVKSIFVIIARRQNNVKKKFEIVEEMQFLTIDTPQGYRETTVEDRLMF